MRLCAWAGARCLLPVLVLLTVLHVQANQHQPRERHYYIAAVEIDWDYGGNDAHRSGPTYKKVVFREYDKGFKQAKTHPSWLGLLGPTLRAEEGETVVVTFRNMATGPHSIHPHGIAYGKQSEGASYFDNTSQKEKEDDVVHPNREHVYYWEITSNVSPQADDPSCLTYSYISHQNVVEDYNSGLIGALLICKPGSLDESGEQVRVHQELVFLFGVFDEKESKYKPSSHDPGNHVKYTINGYAHGSLPDVRICAYTSASLHLLGMSSEPELFSVHMNGQVLQQNGHKISSVGLISGSSTTASMAALHIGRWMLSSHTLKHLEAGMHGFVDVKKCDGFEAPHRRMTIAEKRQSKEWKYYIAAEEIIWDYAPNMHERIDKDFKFQYLRQSSTRIGAKYKKAVYTLYKNESFTERLETKQRKNELGILGPVIRAQIRDVITVVFKNMASRPYSIYPHGLTIAKSEEGVNYPEGGNHSHAVQPGETYTYVWRVVEEDEPLDGDSRCLTRFYHSAVDTPRDIASGLIGPLLICKSHSLNIKNVQLRADKEQHAMFTVFDENKSWYLDENIRLFCDRSKVNKANPDFYKSNVMHTINGYVFETGPVLGFCNGELATWHVSSIGAQDYIQTATFYGHPFELNDRTEDFLSLYPMTGETISMNMDNIGIWLLASLNTHETTKGIRVRFQDVECYRDNEYEYTDDILFDVWSVPTFEEIKKEEEKKPPETETVVVIDDMTEMFAQELGLRSLKKESNMSDVEQLDLSFLDYDDTDRDTNVTLNFTDVKSSSKEVDGLNLPVVDLHTQSISEITTHLHNSTSDSVERDIFAEMFADELGLTSLKNESNMSDVEQLDLSDLSDLSYIVDDATGVFDRDSNVTLNFTESKNKSKDSIPKKNGLNVTSSSNEVDGLNLTVEKDIFTEMFAEELGLRSLKKESNISDVEQLYLSLFDYDATDAFYRDTNLDDAATSDTNTTTALNTTSSSVAGNVSTEMTNLTLPSQGDSVSLLEAGKINLTLAGDDQISLDTVLVEESEETLTRGDVFSYSVLLSNSDNNNLQSTPEENFTSPSHSTGEKDYNITSINHGNVSADGRNHSSSVLNITSIDSHILTTLKVENTKNTSSDNNSLIATMEPELELGLQMNFSDVAPTTIFVELNKTSSSESFSNETGDLSLSIDARQQGSSEELSASESSEEVVIYLRENDTDVIKTTSVKTQGNNWTYDSTHQTVPMEIPVDILKYLGKETLHTTPAPKKTKKVNRRYRPQKGQGMKTRRRVEYKPQPKSGLPFSPRGFNPGMTPRGSRPIAPQPVSEEEQLINMPLVIGVPRPDFSDYELYVPGDEPGRLELDEHDVKADEYEYVAFKDPYSSHEDVKNFNLDETTMYHLKRLGPNVRTYFISAEEVEWDYAGYGQRRQEKSQQNNRETTFTKVVFRGYMDSSFTTPEIRGEIDEHLGILGPVIKAEVGQSIMVVFRNNANRPYSLHPNGVSYTKQTEGLSYEDDSMYWYKYDNEVQPNTTFTYLWKVSQMVGPLQGDSYCRTWTYYSGVNPEKDIHSGLIGPLLVCREGTLEKNLPDMREFVLVFMTFDESQSWYYNDNRETIQRKSRWRIMDRNFRENLKFHSINGIIYNLKGLRMYTNQLVCWHLINMGSPKDFQSVHFHGQTFLYKKTKSYRQAVHPLLPGSFATLEMYPSKPGLWQLETEVGANQQKGMQTLFLVLDDDCYRPLGLESGSVKDDQITAIKTRGYWEPHLARLNNAGKYNAWSTEQNHSWIQVDFQRPVVISQVATQGAKQLFQSHFVTRYAISYSTDRRKWISYKGDSRDLRKAFTGNREAYETKTNTFFPPLIGRFIRLHPINWQSKATVRMEFYGCELDGCSVPLGMESGLIENQRITASSTASNWYFGPWRPSLARLNKQGSVNAWQAKHNDMHQWLQVELPQVKKITGIITQGAKFVGTEMYVISYSLQYSDNGRDWSQYTDDEVISSKTFLGNTNNNDHVKNYIYPPIFSRFIRIIPRSWMNSITMRVELLGCDFE